MKNLRPVLAAVLILVLLVFGSTTLYAKDRGEGHKVRVETEKQNEGVEKGSRERIQVRSQFSNETSGNAENREARKHLKKFVVYGRLVALEERSVTVFVTRATKNGRNLIGKEVAFTIDEKARINLNKKLSQLNDFTEYSLKVSVQGYSDGERLVASRIIVKMPKKVVINGTVSSVFENGFTVKVKTGNNKIRPGEEIRILTSSSTKWTVPSTSTATLKPGVHVQVFGYEKEGELLATRVVIKAKPVAEETANGEETTLTTGTGSEDQVTEGTDEVSATETISDISQESAEESTGNEPLTLETFKTFFSYLLETIRNIFASLF